MTLEIRCPRCGTPGRGAARFCAVCGLDLMSAIPPPPQPPPVQSPLPYIPAGTAPVWPGPQPPERPLSGMPPTHPQSVIAALTPSRPATGAFWVGLVLSILALVLVACPALIAIALALIPAEEASGGELQTVLGISSCLFLVLFVPGITLLAAGRPRRI